MRLRPETRLHSPQVTLATLAKPLHRAHLQRVWAPRKGFFASCMAEYTKQGVRYHGTVNSQRAIELFNSSLFSSVKHAGSFVMHATNY